MISKELLSEVLKLDAKPYNIDTKGRTLYYSVYEDRYECDILDNEINIYELAHKCKEWALKSSYQLHSAMRNGNLPIVVLIDEQDVLRHYFKADTEPEVIFKACQWILENKKD